jgi:hypothetical protein
VASEEGDGAAQEGNRAGGALVAEDLGIGQAAVVVDGDGHELPACDAPGRPGRR